ncbi:hypothetical protein [Actinoplanes subtropicus]|uniref:tRNA ligase subunit PheS family protein n=1 Tax=Actinoplanes subtropicus TaxID=543632 RepID=UPI0006901486|nr:hypothetical protein [Actinoplanes subtropicus]
MSAGIGCSGVVYRRDAIDRLHTGTPHQLDLWRLGDGDLLELVGLALHAALPGVPWRTRPAAHPYTTGGLEIEALGPGGAWVEVGECGLAAEHVLRAAGGPTEASRPTEPSGPTGADRPAAADRLAGAHGLTAADGLAAVNGPAATDRLAAAGGLALGLGLDRLLMLRKGIDDIRLLRSADPRVSSQMTDLTPYRPVSAQPAAHRDLSVALPADVTAEDLGDRVRDLLGDDAHLVEEVTILSVTPPSALPPASRERLNLRDDEANVLLRVVLRDLHTALPKHRANALRDRLWAGLMADRTPIPTA